MNWGVFEPIVMRGVPGLFVSHCGTHSELCIEAIRTVGLFLVKYTVRAVIDTLNSS